MNRTELELRFSSFQFIAKYPCSSETLVRMHTNSVVETSTRSSGIDLYALSKLSLQLPASLRCSPHEVGSSGTNVQTIVRQISLGYGSKSLYCKDIEMLHLDRYSSRLLGVHSEMQRRGVSHASARHTRDVLVEPGAHCIDSG